MEARETERDTLLVSRDGRGIVTITLNRPAKKNAITQQMWIDLAEELDEIALSHDDRVVVLTGAGGAFCAGADLWAGPGSGPPRHQLAAMRQVSNVAVQFSRLPQPTIAKVRGHAVGAGCNMAFMCDLVVAGETAKFSEIFTQRGLSLDFGGSWLLPRRVPLHIAKELAFFADMIDAAEAARIGLVNRVLPDAELDEFVAGWAERLLASPPIALTQSKRMLNNAMMVTLEQALEDEGAAQTINFGTKDTIEAISAWAEKRTPHFQGR